MKQTAVEWLLEQLPTIDKYDPYYAVVILFLSYRLYWYRKFYKSQMNLNEWKDKEKRITELLQK
jgi:hypothetical protein